MEIFSLKATQKSRRESTQELHARKKPKFDCLLLLFSIVNGKCTTLNCASDCHITGTLMPGEISITIGKLNEKNYDFHNYLWT